MKLVCIRPVYNKVGKRGWRKKLDRNGKYLSLKIEEGKGQIGN